MWTLIYGIGRSKWMVVKTGGFNQKQRLLRRPNPDHRKMIDLNGYFGSKWPPTFEGSVTNYRYDMGIGSNKPMFLLNSLKDILVHCRKQWCNQFACIHNQLNISRLLYQGSSDCSIFQDVDSKNNSFQVCETLTGFHCGSHSSLISLTATSFVATDDPIKIKAGDNFMFV